MNFKKVHPDFGIEIKDIKINKINHGEITEIINLFEKYSLIVLKNQKITNEEQLDFAKNFGELEVTKPGTIGSNSNLVSENKSSLPNDNLNQDNSELDDEIPF